MPPSAKIDVIIVRNEGEEIGKRRDCPVRKLPDGTAGVVVHGLVYALRDDHSIDVANDGLPKEDCPKFFSAGEPLVYSDDGGADPWWFFEATSRGSYVAFDGSQDFAERLNEAFAQAGLSRGLNESFRPARNGRFYDYYIRLVPSAEEEDVDDIIAEVSTEDTEDEKDRQAEAALNGLVEILGGPQNFLQNYGKLLAARRQLEEAQTATEKRDKRDEERLRQLSEKVLHLDDAFQKVRDVAKARDQEIQALQSENEQLKIALANSRQNPPAKDDAQATALQNELARLLEQLATARKAKASAEEDLELWKMEVDDLQARNAGLLEKQRELEAKIEIMNKEAEPNEPLPEISISRSKREKQLINEFMTGCFPRIILQDDDLKTILTRFQKLSDTIRIFSTLQRKGELNGIKNFKGKPGLFEIPDVGTGIPGKGKMGRIYYRVINGSDELDVAIHVKQDEKEQERFVSARFG